jgi:hypothetical protein
MGCVDSAVFRIRISLLIAFNTLTETAVERENTGRTRLTQSKTEINKTK